MHAHLQPFKASRYKPFYSSRPYAVQLPNTRHISNSRQFILNNNFITNRVYNPDIRMTELLNYNCYFYHYY